ncbi:hypothetical protein KIW84_054532 [Lathyrus oleraceus]|uniref:RNA-directed DNA polymerase, eukaryota, reverse transcriptase zinc-binding domain protein n=1 Tax=Pisum sativum TaxID=3888 RepID=A0A9D4WXW0_PEA|nr:hypothetical protein KIW84_054532 [Pisum sativum]
MHMWKDVINNIAVRLETWKNRLLSLGGKVVLINIVLNSIPIYSLYFYKAYTMVLKEIRRTKEKYLTGTANGLQIKWFTSAMVKDYSVADASDWFNGDWSWKNFNNNDIVDAVAASQMDKVMLTDIQPLEEEDGRYI